MKKKISNFVILLITIICVLNFNNIGNSMEDKIFYDFKLELINGNLLDFPNGINNIAHSCNCRMIMGGGIAKQIKERYPEAYQADVDFISDEYDHNGQFKHPLGNYSKAKVDKSFLSQKINERNVK